MKKIVWLIIGLLVLAGGLSYKVFYPNSSWQLRNDLKFLEAFPVDSYFLSKDKGCGIWYEGQVNGKKNVGKNNEKVVNCLQKSFENCQKTGVLFVQDDSTGKTGISQYSYLRILQKNDQNDCILQNIYEEQNFKTEESAPISYVNTCLKLADDLLQTCEPDFIDDIRNSNNN